MLDRGQLPNLARLREGGSSGALRSLPGLGDDANWSSFATSVEPGVHGRFHHRQPVAGTYRTANFGREQMTLPPFWQRIAQTGLRVAALDLPKSPMGNDPHLRELADWMPHGADGGCPVSNPPAIARDAARRYAADAFSCHRIIEPGEVAGYAASVMKRLRLREQLALEWLNDESWDLFLVAFAESHCIGHHCWHVHDETHPQHDAAQRDTIGDPIAEVYAAQDKILGRLIESAGADARVIVFSPLGMGPNYSGDRYIDQVLRRIEGVEEPPPRSRRLASLRNRLLGLPDEAFRRRTYYALSHDAISSAVRLNVAGREPAGVIDPADYDSQCAALSEAMLELRDPSCNRRLVRDVVRVTGVYAGPFADRFADLLVVWANDAPITALSSPRTGMIEATGVGERSGNHREGGWFASNAKVAPCSVLDLGPAVAAMLGVSL
jgi:predicted AlkP superfamily phosphohydrolase/phosphomutase